MTKYWKAEIITRHSGNFILFAATAPHTAEKDIQMGRGRSLILATRADLIGTGDDLSDLALGAFRSHSKKWNDNFTVGKMEECESAPERDPDNHVGGGETFLVPVWEQSID